ncbi:mask [Symbiodinium natans]|uniref:Mask protein n=1 Tax=Symbiodinium natans TaxID=878477 RepID=A0A812QHH2_9DINO|nr:mask [Symbiodinium natans]
MPSAVAKPEWRTLLILDDECRVWRDVTSKWLRLEDEARGRLLRASSAPEPFRKKEDLRGYAKRNIAHKAGLSCLELGFPHIFVMMSFRVAFFAALMAVVALVLQGCSDSTDDVVADSNTTTTTLEETNESAAEGNATTTPVADNNATTTVTTTVAEGNSTTTSQESTTTTSTTEAAAEEANATNTSNLTLLL